MTDSMKLAEMQRTSIEFERQRHLANWFIKSSPHMATPASVAAAAAATSATGSATTTGTTTTASATTTTPTSTQHHHGSGGGGGASAAAVTTTTANILSGNDGTQHPATKQHSGNTSNSNPVFFLMASNGNSTKQQQQQQHHHHNMCGGSTPLSSGTPLSPSALAGGSTVVAPTPTPGGSGLIEGRKPKLRRFNSHDTSSNMFSVADFENARLARRNEIEMKQRLQRRMRMSVNSGYGCGPSGGSANTTAQCGGVGLTSGGCSSNGWCSGGGGGANSTLGGGDYSTGDSKASKYSNESQHEPLAAEIFLERYPLPRVVRISYKTKFSDETLQSSSSNGSSTATSHSSTSGGGGVPVASTLANSSVTSTGMGTGTTGTATSSSTASSSGPHHQNTTSSGGSSGSNKHNNTAATVRSSSDPQDQGELFLLYRLVRERHIYHGFNAKTAAANRKKGVLIPQEFPGYFSLVNEKGLPTATMYTSLIQLVRERVYKFVSVDNMPAFSESQPSSQPAPPEGCLPLYSSPPNNRPTYVKTTARGGQVYRLLAVFEDGKQDHNAIGSGSIGANGNVVRANGSHGREKEKGRYAQLLNENRQVMYVSLATKGKFYEIEPGIPQILQKLGGMGNDPNKKVKPDCVHKITAIITPNKELPITLRYISGPNGSHNAIPENLCVTKVSTENVVIACPIEDVEIQSPLHLRKLHLTKEMNLLKSSLGFESEQRMIANPNVQNMLKYCQFNCDQFLKMVEVEILSRPDRSGSKSRVDGLKILKPLHLPKLLRREKTTISAHEKEDSIIFLTKSDLANLEAKDAAVTGSNSAAEVVNGSGHRISDKMKVFQSTKKKWFRKQDKHAATSLTSLDLDVQAKRLSMERYSDMSKLLQERFGDKPNSNSTSLEQESISEHSGVSDIGCSDTETTTLATIEEKSKKLSRSKSAQDTHSMQKSMSLQDIELISGCGSVSGSASRKPDLLASHPTTDTISEGETDLEDLENQPPLPQSFITEKLYNEFHVKTRQYSKSSSSLHQLMNFAMPQKLQGQTGGEQKRSLAQIKQSQCGAAKVEKRLDFNIGEPVTGRRAAGGLSLIAGVAGGSAVASNSGGTSANSQNTSLISPLTPVSLIEDDLPYSSVRDSLVMSSDESAGENMPAGRICQALHLIDYTKENIYAEICHDASAMGGIPSSQTRDTFGGYTTHSTELTDDYGDYASLSYPLYMQHSSLTPTTTTYSGSAGSAGSVVGTSSAGNAISRVQINCSSSPISYHTVYLGEEPLGERHYNEQKQRTNRFVAKSANERQRGDRSHITTVELEGGVTRSSMNNSAATTNGALTTEMDGVGVDNIYNTLK